MRVKPSVTGAVRFRQPTNFAKVVHSGKIFRAKLGKRPSIATAPWVDMNHEALD
jgi:hypothetical protein